ncbi:hypothetical protein [Enterobacter ludwigii]|uniref:hypothetical protein n=1 Tax=Enterobacter ludwigii TaxID=299767 RepID=UPI003526B6AA
MKDDELLNALSAVIMNGYAGCQIGNTCYPEWGVIIAAAGVNFYYDDGSSDVDGPRPVNLSAGQRANFYSKKPKGCVQRMFVAVTVVAPGEPAKNYTANITDCPPNECMSSRGVAIGPKNVHLKGQSLPEWLELTVDQ